MKIIPSFSVKQLFLFLDWLWRSNQNIDAICRSKYWWDYCGRRRWYIIRGELNQDFVTGLPVEIRPQETQHIQKFYLYFWRAILNLNNYFVLLFIFTGSHRIAEKTRPGINLWKGNFNWFIYRIVPIILNIDFFIMPIIFYHSLF